METTSDDQAKRLKKPTRRAVLMRGVVTPIFGLLAVLFIVLGILNATIWKPSATVVARASVSGSRYVVTDPGVLKMVGSDAEVTVALHGRKTEDQRVCMASATAKDVAGWTADSSYARVTGLKDWSTLTVKDAQANQGKASSTNDSDVPFAKSDMWRQVACGKASAHLSLKGLTDDEVVIVDTHSIEKTVEQPSKAPTSGTSPDTKASSPVQVSVRWTRHDLPDYSMPLYVVAGVFVVLAVLSASVFAMDLKWFGRKRRSERNAEPGQTEEVTIAQAVQGTFEVLRSSLHGKRRKPRRAHAVAKDGDQSGSAPSQSWNSPQVVNPSARNMVAELQAQTDSESKGPDGADGSHVVGTQDADEAQVSAVSGRSQADTDQEAPTMVYSMDDFAQYYARLAQESEKADDSDDAENSADSDSEPAKQPKKAAPTTSDVVKADASKPEASKSDDSKSHVSKDDRLNGEGSKVDASGDAHSKSGSAEEKVPKDKVSKGGPSKDSDSKDDVPKGKGKSANANDSQKSAEPRRWADGKGKSSGRSEGAKSHADGHGDKTDGKRNKNTDKGDFSNAKGKGASGVNGKTSGGDAAGGKKTEHDNSDGSNKKARA
jgi:hypothetical protein